MREVIRIQEPQDGKKRGNEFRCDRCGKFIPYSQFDDDTASRAFVPDTEFTIEEFRFRCANCTGKYGNVKIFIV